MRESRTGSGRPGTQISSSRLASPAMGSSTPDAVERRQRGLELAAPAVDEHEVRPRAVLGLDAAVSAVHGLGHAAEVVRLEEILRGDVEEAVVRLLRLAVLEDHERRDAVGALGVGDVEGLDAVRRERQARSARRQPLDGDRLVAPRRAGTGPGGARGR